LSYSSLIFLSLLCDQYFDILHVFGTSTGLGALHFLLVSRYEFVVPYDSYIVVPLTHYVEYLQLLGKIEILLYVILNVSTERVLVSGKKLPKSTSQLQYFSFWTLR
jgi:hypothetical protein